jgi:hypothetical protein
MMIPGGWLGILAVGIILGALDQGARTIVGFKKLTDFTDAASASCRRMAATDFVRDWRGGAGALAALSVLPNTGPISKEQLLGIAAAGYMGADFIEGFIGQISGGAPSRSSGTTVPKTTSDDAVG